MHIAVSSTACTHGFPDIVYTYSALMFMHGITLTHMTIGYVAVTYMRITTYVTGFTKTVLMGTRNEIQFITDY